MLTNGPNSKTEERKVKETQTKQTSICQQKVSPAGHQTLRKTCHSLRNFIDDQTTLDPKLSNLYFIFDLDHITLTLYSEKFDNATKFTYQEAGNDTKLIYEKDEKNHEKIIKDISYIDLFCQDFELLTKNSKSIPYMSLNFLTDALPEKLSKKLQKILKSQNFRTEVLSFEVNGSSQIYSFLQCFDSNFLKTLYISDSNKSDWTLHECLHIDLLEETVKLEQWKKLETVVIHCYTVKKPERFSHVKEGFASFMTIRMEDVEVLKESFLHSPSFSSMELKYNHMQDQPQIFRFLGEHCWIDDRGTWNHRRWFFRMPNPEDGVLSVEVNPNYVIFKSLKWEEVPVGAIVKE
ncbi:hypothetical protein CAEBREN_01113 [Caenorhabditis brenneri]|uniref:DUF38 domain-containing protein n=1 Tax=Caenorhabditis brenneri TaxID=135651 RepID=G0N1H0_CAEBE|nr:hypothetical protein CAEBREN_01113 [Caenorhabditis brenneri]